MDKVNILAVAVYPEMEQLIKNASKDFPEANIDTFYGYHKNAIDYVNAYPKKHFDALISRGGTVGLLNMLVDTPVIGIDIQDVDILQCLSIAMELGKKIAFISYPKEADICKSLCTLLNYDIHVYTIHDTDENETMNFLQGKHYDVIIGGALTLEVANKEKYCDHTLLLRSSKLSIYKAIQSAIETAHRLNKSASVNRLFQEIVEKSSSAVIVFDDNESVCYANAAYYNLDNDKHINYLSQLIPQLKQENSIHRARKSSYKVYEIIGEILTFSDTRYYCFTIRQRYSSKMILSAVEYADYDEWKYSVDSLMNSSYFEPIMKHITETVSTQLPVLLTGEMGCGKEVLAHYIHHSRNNAASLFVTIDCKKLTSKIWDKMMTDTCSAIHAIGYTIFFKDIHTLAYPLQKTIAEYMSDSIFARRNQLICSTTIVLEDTVMQGLFNGMLYKEISGITLYIPSLRERKEIIPQLAELLIDWYNEKLSKNISGLHLSAIERLVSFDWPLNYEQFDNTIRQLVAVTSGKIISLSEVEHILPMSSGKDIDIKAPRSIDLAGTLDEIEVAIINAVMQEESMNQSAVAKRLGISRSTLWRKLNSKSPSIS